MRAKHYSLSRVLDEAVFGQRPDRPLGELWRLMNAPRPTDNRALQLGLTCYLVLYSIAAGWRYDEAHASFVWLRFGVALYIALGVYLAGSGTGWMTLRRYAVGFALCMPSSTAYIAANQGDDVVGLILSCLLPFVCMIFMPAAVDIVIAAIGLVAICIVIVLLGLPPSVPVFTLSCIYSGSILAAAVTALFVRRMACERERVVRELAELTASKDDSRAILDQFASQFCWSFSDGRAMILIRRPGAPLYDIANVAGLPKENADALLAQPLRIDLARFVARVVASRRVEIETPAGDVDGWRSADGATTSFLGNTLVGLPVFSADQVAGVILLASSEKRAIRREELALWKSMAMQVGIAICKSDLVMRLESALDAKNAFVDTISHELRTPLNVILGYVEMLADGGVDGEMAAERVRSSALDLVRLIENTTTVAGVGSDKLRVWLTEFPLAELVRELETDVAALPEARGAATIEWQVTPDPIPIRIDRAKLKAIVENLVSNALKYGRQSDIQVEISRSHGELSIAVRDAGPGIAMDDQSRIFEMFERGSNASDGDPQPGGAGLGLYIVRSLVSLLHGTIQLVSRPGEGATFIVRLPLENEIEHRGTSPDPGDVPTPPQPSMRGGSSRQLPVRIEQTR